MTEVGSSGATGEKTDDGRPAAGAPLPAADEPPQSRRRRAPRARPWPAVTSVLAGSVAGLLFLPVVPFGHVLPSTAASAGRAIAGHHIASGILPAPSHPSGSGRESNSAPDTRQWVAPAHGLISSGFRKPDRPNHNGVDLAAPRGTLIHAASAGTVTTVRCEVTPADHGCDVDGSLSVLGCGWYVDIEHAGGVVTRYCHQLVHPLVRVGQRVAAGEVIGRVGTSGNSSGPHLHFEVHLGDGTAATATDPVVFLARRGVRLG
jgi:murein DD-endopeptidase MepM/ murein hydrolase activator NlpD